MQLSYDSHESVALIQSFFDLHIAVSAFQQLLINSFESAP
jgi:hypothetical protein